MSTNIKNFHVTAYDGHALGSPKYNARIRTEVAPVAAAAYTYTERANTNPVFGYTKQQGRILPVSIEIIAGGGGSAGELLGWLDTTAGPKTLTVTDNTDSSEWYVAAKVVEIPRALDTLLDVNFYVNDPIWTAVLATTETWNVTASGQTKALAVGGTRNTQPVITITPRAAKGGGFGNKRWCPVYNPIDAAQPNYPYDLVSNSWNAAAIIAAGDMLANGDDLRVLLNGVEISRWLQDINTSTAQVWTTLDFPAGNYFKLDGALGTGAITTIAVKKTALAKKMLTRLGAAANKVVTIKTGSNIEAFVFTGVDLVAYTLTGVTRAMKQTTARAHSDNDDIHHIPFDIWLAWSNASLGAPDLDATQKPIIELDSTNAQWTWAEYYDSTAPNRPGTWMRGVERSAGQQSAIYTANHLTEADPAEEMGLVMRAWQDGLSIWRPEVAVLFWEIALAGGFTHVTTTGEKWSELSSWPVTAGLQAENIAGDALVTKIVFNEGIPGTPRTWEACTCTATGEIALGATYKKLRYVVDGTLPGANYLGTGNYAAIEFDGVSAKLDTSMTPVTEFAYTSAVAAPYHLAARISSSTGDYFEIDYMGVVNEAVVIDCRNMTVIYNDDTRIPGAMQASNPDTWMELEAGVTNTLTYTDTGTNDVDVEIEYYERCV